MNRALLVDTLPTSDQATGNAWAARMLGIGSMAGFFVYAPHLLIFYISDLELHSILNSSGNVDLPHMFPFLGRGQLEVLSIIASFLLVATQMLTAFCVKEKVLISSKYVYVFLFSDLLTCM
jgi:solute carrier family 45 protein 1/2/4